MLQTKRGENQGAVRSELMLLVLFFFFIGFLSTLYRMTHPLATTYPLWVTRYRIMGLLEDRAPFFCGIC